MSLEEAFEKIAMHFLNGFLMPKYGFEIEDMNDVINMEIRPGDVFVVTYPKCGTTWTQYVIWGIMHKGSTPPDLNEMMESAFPFLEMTGVSAAEDLPSPRTMKLHTPYNYSPINSEAKYVIVIRNPFDCCISWFNHIKNMKSLYLSDDLTFDEFFDFFLEGHVPFGNYFHFVRSWHEHKDEANVYFMYYEHMKANFAEEVTKLMQFLGEEYAEAASDDAILNAILHHSSFDYMKNNLKMSIPVSIEPDAEQEEVVFIRKGETDDWKNYMSEEQKNRLREKCEQEIEDAEILRNLIPKSVIGE